MIPKQQIDNLIKEFFKKTVVELDFIIRNMHAHSQDQVIAAKEVIELKRALWRTKNIETSRQINEIIQKETCFDFHILSFDGHRLIIGGSIDLTYYHNLEVVFEDIFFVSSFFKKWQSNTKQTVFKIPDNEIQLNEKYEIEQDYQLFMFQTEYFKNDVLIAANSISYNTDKVFYYDKSDLKSNERIAEFVKNKNAI